jgi:branched-chain amino acid transport system substrate-binding protein
VTAWVGGAAGLAALVLAAPAAGAPATPPSPVPFAEARARAVTYAGPGREEPEPPGLTEVGVAYFGPADGDDPDGGAFWRGAALAVEDANGRGGCAGRPVRLIPSWSSSPWSAGITKLTRTIFDDRTWAVVGSIDGSASHLAEQVAAKALITLVSPGSTDRTVNMANVPWMFSLLPSDAAQAPVVGRALVAGGGDYVLASATDHDSRAASDDVVGWLARQGHGPRLRVELRPEEADLAPFAARILDERPSGVLVLAPARTAGRLVRSLRRQGYRGRIVGGATLGRGAFRAEAGEAADGVVFPLLYDPGDAWSRFSERFATRYGEPPDYAAGAAYDAVSLVVAAIGEAGLNRARIEDAVRALSPWSGVMGPTRWDPLGQNVRAVGLATRLAGRVVPVERR